METEFNLYIKNMVCDRCILVVNQILHEVGIAPLLVTLGRVRLPCAPDKSKLEQLDRELLDNGFERIDDKKSQLLEAIKSTVIETIHHNSGFQLQVNWSHHLAEKLGYDYNYLSALFSTVTGVTLEQYIIRQKVEKVKEFLFYDELSVKEIAFKLGYSSVAHLSTQFKKVTGLTPTSFKESRESLSRKPLDGII